MAVAVDTVAADNVAVVGWARLVEMCAACIAAPVRAAARARSSKEYA